MRGKVDEAVRDAQQMLARQQAGGEIVLVGAGPGDPDLITLRGLRAIQSADVLMYDKLVHPTLLDYARRDVELVDVGKQGPRERKLVPRVGVVHLIQSAGQDQAALICRQPLTLASLMKPSEARKWFD